MGNVVSGTRSDVHETANQLRRITALRRLALLDDTIESAFDRLTRLVTNVLDVPVAVVVLIEDDHLIFKSAAGLQETWGVGSETRISRALYAHILKGKALIVEDAPPNAAIIRPESSADGQALAYAGIPLMTSEGLALGSVCALDMAPRQWSERDLSVLHDLAAMVTIEIELRATALVAERQARRVAGLQHVTESLSAVLTPAEAARVVLEQGAGVLGADAGLVGLLSDDRRELRFIAAVGYHVGLANQPIPLDAPLPSAEIVRTGHSLYFSSRREVEEHFAGRDLTSYAQFYDPYEAVAAVPLTVHGRTIGSLSLRFRHEIDFAEDGTDFYETLARQCAQAVDRTQLLEAERQARDQVDRLARAKVEFLSDVAHDLQNPLTSIKGFAQILLRYAKRGTLDEERVLRSASQIESTAARMGDLIQELLDVATIERGNPVALKIAPVNLIELVRRSADSQEVRTADHDLQVHADGDEIVGEWDERRLERVLANLLSNAVKYSEAGSRIDVKVRDAGGGIAELTISDRGIGIPEDDLPYIFDRFRRGSNVKGMTSGTGLGLAGVKQLVEQHGGSIAIQSAVGVGTTVTVRLPIAES